MLWQLPGVVLVVRTCLLQCRAGQWEGRPQTGVWPSPHPTGTHSQSCPSPAAESCRLRSGTRSRTPLLDDPAACTHFLCDGFNTLNNRSLKVVSSCQQGGRSREVQWQLKDTSRQPASSAPYVGTAPESSDALKRHRRTVVSAEPVSPNGPFDYLCIACVHSCVNADTEQKILVTRCTAILSRKIVACSILSRVCVPCSTPEASSWPSGDQFTRSTESVWPWKEDTCLKSPPSSLCCQIVAVSSSDALARRQELLGENARSKTLA